MKIVVYTITSDDEDTVEIRPLDGRMKGQKRSSVNSASVRASSSSPMGWPFWQPTVARELFNDPDVMVGPLQQAGRPSEVKTKPKRRPRGIAGPMLIELHDPVTP